MHRWLFAWFATAASCHSDAQSTTPATTPPPERIADNRPTVDAPASLDEAVARLRVAGLPRCADAIVARVNQRSPKMRLSADQAIAAAISLLAISDVAVFRALHDVMPRSTVELARAIAERGVPRPDAEAIAAYLVPFVAALAFERLAVFDDNHSHVTGRHWHEIDYTGEGMTWQGQRDYWTPRGVRDFRKVEHIHAYFVGAEKLPHWRRVYRPRGQVSAVTRP